MSPSRNNPGVAFWATVVVVGLLVGYPLSFGPACWIAFRSGAQGLAKTVDRICYPIVWFREPSPC